MARTTLQKMVNKAYKHYITDKLPPGFKPELGNSGTCFYTDREHPCDPAFGMCIIGCQLPKTKLKEILSIHTDSISDGNVEVAGVLGLDEYLGVGSTELEKLQNIHDTSAWRWRLSPGAFREDVANGLARFCREYGLRYHGG